MLTWEEDIDVHALRGRAGRSRRSRGSWVETVRPLGRIWPVVSWGAHAVPGRSVRQVRGVLIASAINLTNAVSSVLARPECQGDQVPRSPRGQEAMS